jgi:hypothetical protein
MLENLRDKKDRVLRAAEKSVDELIKVLEQQIVNYSIDDDLSVDKMKNAAAAKRLAFEDALSILERIDAERAKETVSSMPVVLSGSGGFAEGRARSNAKK